MEIARLELPAELRARLRDIILDTAAAAVAAGHPDGAVRSPPTPATPLGGSRVFQGVSGTA